MSNTASISLAGKVSVVTGAAGGLGKAMSFALARAGSMVVGVDVNVGALAQVESESAQQGLKNFFIPMAADLGSDLQTALLVESILKQCGRIDVLVNNAGLAPRHSQPNGATEPYKFWKATIDGYQSTFNVSVMGAFILSRAAAENMLLRDWGRIVNITTSYDTMVRGGISAYGPAKAALEAATCVWAQDLASTGVTANVLVPGGATLTGLIPPENRSRADLLSPDIMQAPVTYLASHYSDGVSGARFTADEWDLSMSLSDAAAKARAPAGWPTYADSAQNRRRHLGRK